jgi:AcrR family transcriptional regulator
VGLTKAGLYHYIRGKEDLLFQIMSFGMDMVDEDVIAPARRIGDAQSRLRAIVERHGRRIMEQGGAVTILLEEMPALTPTHQRIIRNRKRAYFELVRDTLGELSAEGRLRDLDSNVAAFTLFGMILWTSRWYRDGGTLTPEQAAADLGEMAMSAVLNGRREDSMPHSTGSPEDSLPESMSRRQGRAPRAEPRSSKRGHIEHPIKRPVKQPVQIANAISGKGSDVTETKIFGSK